MFFRRERPKEPTFEDHLNAARSAGFRVESVAGKTRVERNSVACILEPGPNSVPRMDDCGLAMGKEIAILTDDGFQKFFITPSGKRKPALAEELKAIHDFQADLRQALGLESFYNESLGTVSARYLYDRVSGRDRNYGEKPWEVKV